MDAYSEFATGLFHYQMYLSSNSILLTDNGTLTTKTKEE